MSGMITLLVYSIAARHVAYTVYTSDSSVRKQNNPFFGQKCDHCIIKRPGPLAITGEHIDQDQNMAF